MCAWSAGSIWIGVFVVTALSLGVGAAILANGLASNAQHESQVLEAKIRSSLTLLKRAPETARKPPKRSHLLIDEPRPQLAMASLQGIVRDKVQAFSGAVSSTNAANGTPAPWGATVRLDTEFEAPAGSIVDILKALEAGKPKVMADQVSLSLRERSDVSGRQRQFVVARVTFSAFTTAKLDQP